MPSSTLRVVRPRQRAAERPGRHSHAERGYEDPPPRLAQERSIPPGFLATVSVFPGIPYGFSPEFLALFGQGSPPPPSALVDGARAAWGGPFAARPSAVARRGSVPRR